MRLLLLHVPGALSYKDLCNAESVENNNSFRVAAKARNLIRDIDDVDQILQEMMDSQCSETNSVSSLLSFWCGTMWATHEDLEKGTGATSPL